jgi:spoIIIJ-associated protein
MSVEEFEGKNEEEAISRAIEALGLNRDEIDVEIVETRKSSFLFGGGKVRIRVHLEEDAPEEHAAGPSAASAASAPESEFEKQMVEFLRGLVERIGVSARVRIGFREQKKLGIDLDSQDSGILIGKKGQTLEAIQTIANVVAGRVKDGVRVVVDSQNYRSRRERSLVRMAEATAEEVRRTGHSRLLEAMNPFERRLVHTALSNLQDIQTESEGEGMYKRVRILYRGGAK